MTAVETLLRGRAFAEEQQIDHCVITRSLNTRTFNATTGTYAEGSEETIYDGPCQVQIAGSSDATTPSIEGGGPTLQQLLVKLPVTATRFKIRDLVRVTAAPLDPDLVGRRFSVTAGHNKTYATARRLQCEEVAPT